MDEEKKRVKTTIKSVSAPRAVSGGGEIQTDQMTHTTCTAGGDVCTRTCARFVGTI